MKILTRIQAGLRKNAILYLLTVAYFAVGTILILAEYFKDFAWIVYSKPFMMPLLIAVYAYTSKRPNLVFVISLAFAWIGNIIFISKDFDFIIAGTAIYTFYRILMIYIVVKLVRLPGYFPLMIGCLPFLFLYLVVMNLTAEELGDGFYLFAAQGILNIIFGGIALGNYIFKSNKANTYLLISTMLFTFTQFLFVIRLFYISMNIFQPLSMFLFVIAQYLLSEFMILEENKILETESILQES